MHAYELSPRPEARSSFHKDLQSLKAAIRLVPQVARVDVRVKLVDISLAKVDAVSILNGCDPVVQVLRYWRISNRCRLIEIAVDSEE